MKQLKTSIYICLFNFILFFSINLLAQKMDLNQVDKSNSSKHSSIVEADGYAFLSEEIVSCSGCSPCVGWDVVFSPAKHAAIIPTNPKQTKMVTTFFISKPPCSGNFLWSKRLLHRIAHKDNKSKDAQYRPERKKQTG